MGTVFKTGERCAAALASSLSLISPTSRARIVCRSLSIPSIASIAVFAARRTAGWGLVSSRSSHWARATARTPTGPSSLAWTS